MYRICIITTMSSSIDYWIRPFFEIYNRNGIDVTVIANMNDEFINTLPQYVKAINIQMDRGINLKSSILATYKIYKILVQGNYDLIQYSTPNASMYAALASYLAHVPIRLYCQWGLIHVSFKGVKKMVFRMMERIKCAFSTNIQPDSFGNLKLCIDEKIYTSSKGEVIWNGSAKGVDALRFDICKKEKFRDEIRQEYNIPNDSLVIGFVGRLGKDKGCNELFEAYKNLNEKYKNIVLLFVGPLEKPDTIQVELLDYFFECSSIIKTGRVIEVEKYYAAMDIFILPSYREGFGMSVVEAQAMGVPVLVTNIPGPTDGMVNSKTGFIFEVKSVSSLVAACEKLIIDSKLRNDFSESAVKYAYEHFDATIFTEKLIENRKGLLMKVSKTK